MTGSEDLGLVPDSVVVDGVVSGRRETGGRGQIECVRNTICRSEDTGKRTGSGVLDICVEHVEGREEHVDIDDLV